MITFSWSVGEFIARHVSNYLNEVSPGKININVVSSHDKGNNMIYTNLDIRYNWDTSFPIWLP